MPVGSRPGRPGPSPRLRELREAARAVHCFDDTTVVVRQPVSVRVSRAQGAGGPAQSEGTKTTVHAPVGSGVAAPVRPGPSPRQGQVPTCRVRSRAAL